MWLVISAMQMNWNCFVFSRPRDLYYYGNPCTRTQTLNWKVYTVIKLYWDMMRIVWSFHIISLQCHPLDVQKKCHLQFSGIWNITHVTINTTISRWETCIFFMADVCDMIYLLTACLFMWLLRNCMRRRRSVEVWVWTRCLLGRENIFNTHTKHYPATATCTSFPCSMYVSFQSDWMFYVRFIIIVFNFHVTGLSAEIQSWA